MILNKIKKYQENQLFSFKMSEKMFEKIHHLSDKYHQVLIETHKSFPFLVCHDDEISVQKYIYQLRNLF
jgi:hypothetical protein